MSVNAIMHMLNSPRKINTWEPPYVNIAKIAYAARNDVNAMQSSDYFCIFQVEPYGDKMGFEFLGELYYLGEEITRDYDKAFLYYLFAKGDFNAPESYFNMAYMYDKGYGTCKNSKLAMTYYKKGIERWEYFFGNLPPKKLDEYNVDKDKYLKAKRRLKNLEKKLI